MDLQLQQTDTDSTSMARKKTLWGQLANVFHEPEIPLKDKIVLGPIDKYIVYSKDKGDLKWYRSFSVEADDSLTADSLHNDASYAHSLEQE